MLQTSGCLTGENAVDSAFAQTEADAGAGLQRQAHQVSMHDVLRLEQFQPTCDIPQQVQQAQHVLLI